jgi:hypothetical protein
MTTTKVATLLHILFGALAVLYLIAVGFLLLFGWLLFGGPSWAFWADPHAFAVVAFLTSLPGYLAIYVLSIIKTDDAQRRGYSERVILRWAASPTIGLVWTLAAAFRSNWF